MNYEQTITYLFETLPMYQRIGDMAIKKDLTNIRSLCALMGNPHQHFPSIHIAGTNGKGSTSHMLASVFQASGRTVGLYTSPHYTDFRERIKINGKMIGEEDVIRFVETYKKTWEDISPSFFEITVAMAFYYFRKKNVDIAIIETGLGGRLDSTNIITPLLTVITNIGYDHMQMLGQTLPEIAQEKAGIIKQNVPVVVGEWHKETSTVFKQTAKKKNAPISFASRHIQLKKRKINNGKDAYEAGTKIEKWPGKFITDVTGPFQEKNIRTVLGSCWMWNRYYPQQTITRKMVIDGLRNVRSSTFMVGRWMIIRDKPLVVTDAAHNIDGMKMIVPELLKIKSTRRHFVLGFVADKDVHKILSLFPEDASYYWCSPDIPRGKPAVDSMKEGLSLGLLGFPFDSVRLAFDEALSNAENKDLIFVGGSSYVTGDFLASLQSKK